MEIPKNVVNAWSQIDGMQVVSVTLSQHGRFTRREANWPHFAIVKFPGINLFPRS
jgi:hypothetical protein